MREKQSEDQRGNQIKVELELMKEEMRTLKEGINQVLLSSRQESKNVFERGESNMKQLDFFKKWMMIVLKEKQLIQREKTEVDLLKKKYRQKQKNFSKF